MQPSLRRPLRTFLTAVVIGAALVLLVLLIVYTRRGR
jgi:multisubunit Na+/H+ antiporter MnhC subunit